MLALAAMLLVYCVPVVIPPLQWINISIVTDFCSCPANGLRYSASPNWIRSRNAGSGDGRPGIGVAGRPLRFGASALAGR